jgi:uncharacterized SAM-binding protein YcdF (DUF218 family)
MGTRQMGLFQQPIKGGGYAMRWTRLLQAVGLAGILLFLTFTFSPLPNVLFRSLEVASDIRAADAIVVLGASVDRDGTLSCESLVRAVRGITLLRDGRAPIVVFSGPSKSGGPSEAQVRAQLARSMGIPPDGILIESAALTTREEALRIGATLQARNAHRILLVTDSQHMRRARPLFERDGLRVFPATADVRSSTATSSEGRLQLMRDVLGAWLALGYYRLAGYL